MKTNKIMCTVAMLFAITLTVLACSEHTETPFQGLQYVSDIVLGRGVEILGKDGSWLGGPDISAWDVETYKYGMVKIRLPEKMVDWRIDQRTYYDASNKPTFLANSYWFGFSKNVVPENREILHRPFLTTCAFNPDSVDRTYETTTPPCLSFNQERYDQLSTQVRTDNSLKNRIAYQEGVCDITFNLEENTCFVREQADDDKDIFRIFKGVIIYRPANP